MKHTFITSFLWTVLKRPEGETMSATIRLNPSPTTIPQMVQDIQPIQQQNAFLHNSGWNSASLHFLKLWWIFIWCCTTHCLSLHYYWLVFIILFHFLLPLCFKIQSKNILLHCYCYLNNFFVYHQVDCWFIMYYIFVYKGHLL